MMATQERPGIEERYQTANNTSNLTVKAEAGGAGDVLIAAGWSDSRIGMALLRLHSEWDSAAKPPRVSEAGIKALAERFKVDEAKARESAKRTGKAYTSQGSPMSRARSEAIVWYARELRLLANGLKSRGPVLAQIHAWALLKGLHADDVGPALFHWLSPTCPVCDGHGMRKVPDQPALSAKQCHACNGTGHRHRPAGAAIIQNWMEDCVNKARQSLKKRLANTR
jgi:hypothetical protein